MQLSQWTVAIGILFALFGLVTLAAGQQGSTGEGILAVGSGAFATGVLIVSAGLYWKARAIQRASSGNFPGAAPAVESRRGKVPCYQCKASSALVYCKAHNMRLCANCLAQHDDPQACVYVPVVRRKQRQLLGRRIPKM